MTGRDQPQDLAHGELSTPGSPGSTDRQRLETSVHFQHQVRDVDIAPSSAAQAQQPTVPPKSIDVSSVTPEQLKDLETSLGAARLQGLRVANFAYEPMSLPASRTASHDDDSHHASGHHTPISGGSPLLVAKAQGTQSPPMSPSGTPYLEADRKSPKAASFVHTSSSPRHGATASQGSSRKEASHLSSRGNLTIDRPESSGNTSHRPVSSSSIHDQILDGNHRKGMFSIGSTVSGSSGSGKSLPTSREGSPSRNSASQFYTRSFTPSGDTHDPYAANKRQPQQKIEPRFVFSRLSRKKDKSPTASTTSFVKHKDEKRHSGLFGNHHQHKYDYDGDTTGNEDNSQNTHSRQSSMSDLKRFFKLGPSHHHKIKRAVSPAVSIRSAKNPVSKSNTQIPFGDEHSLTSKYGKIGRVLGAGAGGSVRLMKRSEDSTVFAVKEFRARHAHENEKEYVKKLTAEYCIGSSLHHGNIIETLDIIREKTRWYEVMEYAPYDLFAIVMTGRMTRAEVACCFLQILSGVTYLHSMGLAHRDLKLDNVVVSEHGIMKIIDFGSAHVFKYPFESGIVLASGIVGSDPYLAPEVYDERKYDPTAVDIWSLAIIFCCMTLRRFPWKIPRMSDNSYKLFASEPTPGHDPRKLSTAGPKSASVSGKTDDGHFTQPSEKEEPEITKNDDKDGPAKTGKSGHPEDGEPSEKDGLVVKKEHDLEDKNNDERKNRGETATEAPKTEDKPAEKKEIIRGPWRILRLLPRESRHVIGGMLEIDPSKRIKMPQLLQDPWVADTVICRQVESGRILRSSTHTHILEQPSPAMK
ncbi:MAG: Nitrogen permease reactivator protein [Sporothrix epigloea]